MCNLHIFSSDHLGGDSPPLVLATSHHCCWAWGGFSGKGVVQLMCGVKYQFSFWLFLLKWESMLMNMKWDFIYSTSYLRRPLPSNACILVTSWAIFGVGPLIYSYKVKKLTRSLASEKKSFTYFFLRIKRIVHYCVNWIIVGSNRCSVGTSLVEISWWKERFA